MLHHWQRSALTQWPLRIHSPIRMNAGKAIDEVDRISEPIHQLFLCAGPLRKTVITCDRNTNNFIPAS